MLKGPWRIELLGSLKAVQGEREVTRFRTEKTGALLAYLAYFAGRAFSRDELIDVFWPQSDLERGRMSLRTALSSLRRQLEPPDTPAGSVLEADSGQVALNRAAIVTDVSDYERAMKLAYAEPDECERAARLVEAVSIYRGDLLTCYYDDWIVPERERLLATYISALRCLTRHFAQRKDLARSLAYAQAIVKSEVLNEEAHRDVIRLYLALGRTQTASQHMEALLAMVRDKLERQPSESTLQLAELVARRTQVSASPSEPIASTRRDESDTEPLPASARLETGPARRIPMRLTRFFGRSEELSRLRDRLHPQRGAGDRLVTLTGISGTGKTRLAMEIAESLASEYEGAVWFVSLEDATDSTVVAGYIQDALGLKRSPSIDAIDQIASAISGSPALLVLDNLEQVVDAGAPVIAALLSRAPQARCLITSRRRLDLPGEREVPLDALPVPVVGSDPASLVQVPSVQLFVDRAQAVRQDFQVTRGNADSVARLCALLEGIPLALELAAARAHVLTTAQMVDRISERFTLLAGRRADKSARHRSLWAAIDWSYRLLSPELQIFFKKLSVFRGGWTVETSSSVTGEPRALDYLTQLRAHSLVVAQEQRSEFRFKMLDSIREFGEDQRSPEEYSLLEKQHLDYFAMRIEAASEAYSGTGQAAVFDDLEIEMENLRAALAAAGRRAPLTQLGMAANLARFWLAHGHFREGRAELSLALSNPSNNSLIEPEAIRVRAHALGGAGSLAWVQSDFDAARIYLLDALGLHNSLNDLKSASYNLMWLGNIAYREGNLAEAKDRYEQSLGYFRKSTDTEGLGYTLVWLGNVESRQANFSAAESLYTECLGLSRQHGNTQVASYALNGLGYCAYRQGRFAESEALHKECLQDRRELGDKLGIANSFESLALLAFATGNMDRAAMLGEAAAALRDELGAPLSEAIVREFQEMLERLRNELPLERIEEIAASARAMSCEEACALALGEETESPEQ